VELTARADAALYEAKRSGRARVVTAKDLEMAELMG
jgi:PleD family two-component response regulator